jgi:hypothetical protein
VGRRIALIWTAAILVAVAILGGVLYAEGTKLLGIPEPGYYLAGANCQDLGFWVVALAVAALVLVILVLVSLQREGDKR